MAESILHMNPGTDVHCSLKHRRAGHVSARICFVLRISRSAVVPTTVSPSVLSELTDNLTIISGR